MVDEPMSNSKTSFEEPLEHLSYFKHGEVLKENKKLQTLHFTVCRLHYFHGTEILYVFVNFQSQDYSSSELRVSRYWTQKSTYDTKTQRQRQFIELKLTREIQKALKVWEIIHKKKKRQNVLKLKSNQNTLYSIWTFYHTKHIDSNFPDHK